jgi:hypothetical protein
VTKLDEIIPVNGVVIHSQYDWPCSGCRPRLSKDQGGTFLCVKCAIALTAASIRRLADQPGTGPAEASAWDSETEAGSGIAGWVPPVSWERK